MRALDGADLVLCDSLVKTEVRSKRCVAYRLVDEHSIRYLGAAMESYQDR
jgi:hypothetical protein